MPQDLSDDDYARLLAIRTELRRFQRWSEERAGELGLTATQHQLLLAVRGHDGDPTISDVADYLLVRHHTVVGLADRVQALGLVTRVKDQADQRVVRLQLTAAGRRVLRSLSQAHLAELHRLTPLLSALDLGTGSSR